MRRGNEARWASLAALVIALTLGSAASAQSTINIGPFSVACTSSGQLCSPTFDVPFATGGLVQVSYTASPGHCSNVRVHFLVDGVELGVTAFLGPGVSSGTTVLSPVSAGTHTLSLQGEGQVGGCNTGSLGNWGGTAQLTVDGVAAQATAVPGPGLVPVALLIALAALALRRAGRRR